MKIFYIIVLGFLCHSATAQNDLFNSFHTTGQKRTVKIFLMVSDSSGKVFVISGYETQKQIARDVDPGINGGEGYSWEHELFLDNKKRPLTKLIVWNTRDQ